MPPPRIISTTEISNSEAKWITLKRINWEDEAGTPRIWEFVQRKTTSSAGVDGTGIFTILRSKTNAFPPSTIVIEQYRPPLDKFVIEMPAGLIDRDESAEEAAIRELEEETGFKADRIIESTPAIFSEPGITNANMKLVIASVDLEDKLIQPMPKLEEGEFIVTRVVELDKLCETLAEYDRKGFVVDARLSHFAAGFDVARRIRSGAL